jgi:hypothetical protein
LDVLGRDVKYSTDSVGARSRIFARQVCRETGLRVEQVLAWLEKEGLGNGE